MTPRSSAEYAARRRRVLLALLLAIQRVWRQMKPAESWEDRYAEDLGPRILALVLAAQVATTRDADAYVAAVLTELALDADAAAGVVPATAFAGLAGDGRPVETLLASTVGRARAALAQPRFDTTVDAGAEALRPDLAAPATPLRDFDVVRRQALDDGEKWMSGVVSTLLADTARAAESVAITQNPRVDGWTRMLNPPSCSRCVVLAGRFYRWSDGFERHPLCDCIHIPTSETLAGDLRVSPDDYFDSLTRAEQDRIFGQAGAQAIRDGADIGQVVNADRGVQRAQVFGREVLVTTEGTTRRGLAYQALNARFGRADDVRTRGEQYFRTSNIRLMPETIYDIAGGDRAEAIRLLRLNGYLT